MLAWLIALPGRAVMAPARLVGIGDNLDSIEDSTRTLPDIHSSMRAIAADTAHLQQVARDIAGIQAATEVLPAIDERMASIDARMTEIAGSLDRLLLALETLDTNLGALRIPRRRQRAVASD
jgi:hypothetical protein